MFMGYNKRLKKLSIIKGTTITIYINRHNTIWQIEFYLPSIEHFCFIEH